MADRRSFPILPLWHLRGMWAQGFKARCTERPVSGGVRLLWQQQAVTRVPNYRWVWGGKIKKKNTVLIMKLYGA